MRASANGSARRATRVLAGGALLLALHNAWAAGFFVVNARSELVDGVYRLNANISYQLSDDVEQALANGIPIAVELAIEIQRPRAYYLWSESIASLQQRYRLQYHALSQRFTVTNLNSGAQDYYATLNEALVRLGAVVDLPMIDQSLLVPGEKYVARLRIDMDYDVLPVPLRYYAFALPEWRLYSDWYSFPL
jgi:hypothetical protein